MANAAAKKAAAAKESATSIYLPLILILNAIYIFIRVVYQWETFTVKHMILSVILWVLTYISYRGIIEDHANTTSSFKSASGGRKQSEKLAGGASLDLLGLVVVIQFGSVLVSGKFYWLLAILPLWAVWHLYSLFGGGSGGGGLGSLFGLPSSSSGTTSFAKGGKEKENEAAAERRRKRAEKRRMKWS